MNKQKRYNDIDPDIHPMEVVANWLKSEERKERESKVFNRRNRYRIAFAINALHLLASLMITNMTDNELVIVVLVFGLAWLAGWRTYIIIQWRK